MCHENYVKAPNKRCEYCSINMDGLMRRTLKEGMEFNNASREETLNSMADWMEENQ